MSDLDISRVQSVSCSGESVSFVCFNFDKRVNMVKTNPTITCIISTRKELDIRWPVAVAGGRRVRYFV